MLALPVDVISLYPAGMLLKVALFPLCVFLSRRERNRERVDNGSEGINLSLRTP